MNKLMWVFVESHRFVLIKHLSCTVLRSVSSVFHPKEKRTKKKKRRKCSEGLLLCVFAVGAYCHATLRRWSFITEWSRHNTPECGFVNVDFASLLYTLYRRRSTLETPLFRIDPFNLTWPRLLASRRIKLRAWKSVFLFRGFPRDSFSRSRDPLVNTIYLHPPSLCALPPFIEATN